MTDTSPADEQPKCGYVHQHWGGPYRLEYRCMGALGHTGNHGTWQMLPVSVPDTGQTSPNTFAVETALEQLCNITLDQRDALIASRDSWDQQLVQSLQTARRYAKSVLDEHPELRGPWKQTRMALLLTEQYVFETRQIKGLPWRITLDGILALFLGQALPEEHFNVLFAAWWPVFGNPTRTTSSESGS